MLVIVWVRTLEPVLFKERERDSQIMRHIQRYMQIAGHTPHINTHTHRHAIIKCHPIQKLATCTTQSMAPQQQQQHTDNGGKYLLLLFLLLLLLFLFLCLLFFICTRLVPICGNNFRSFLFAHRALHTRHTLSAGYAVLIAQCALLLVASLRSTFGCKHSSMCSAWQHQRVLSVLAAHDFRVVLIV